MASKITLNSPVPVVYESRISFRTVYVYEIRVLRRSKKPYAVFDKEGGRYDFEYLDFESQDRINAIVERNKKYL